MRELTAKAEALIGIVEQMRKLQEQFMEYCTGNCHDCPIKKLCDWDRVIDFTDKKFNDIEYLADFVNYHDMYEDKLDLIDSLKDSIHDSTSPREREELECAWEDACLWAGIDPRWADLRR